MIFKNLPNELKYEIISFLNAKCFRCNKIIYYLKNDKYYRFFPPFLDNDESFKGYVVCPLCLFSINMVSRFSNKSYSILPPSYY